MGLQHWRCKYCNHGFGWCSIGGFRSWGEHAKDCRVLKSKRQLKWEVRNI